MSIFSRTRDIMAANFTELLDRAEDPARMIRMIILEMEETLVEVRATAARSIADIKEMRRSVARLNEIQANWTDKAELALSKGREDLAKAQSFGIRGLHERAGTVGGWIDLSSRPGGGTTLILSIPLAAEGGDGAAPDAASWGAT